MVKPIVVAGLEGVDDLPDDTGMTTTPTVDPYPLRCYHPGCNRRASEQVLHLPMREHATWVKSLPMCAEHSGEYIARVWPKSSDVRALPLA